MRGRMTTLGVLGIASIVGSHVIADALKRERVMVRDDNPAPKPAPPAPAESRQVRRARERGTGRYGK